MSKKSTQTDLIKLFVTGMLQVFFVAVNTYFLAKEIAFAVFFTSFVISLIWSYNIKKIVFGNWLSRAVYALGAAIGSVLGLWSSKTLFVLFSQF